MRARDDNWAIARWGGRDFFFSGKFLRYFLLGNLISNKNNQYWMLQKFAREVEWENKTSIICFSMNDRCLQWFPIGNYLCHYMKCSVADHTNIGCRHPARTRSDTIWDSPFLNPHPCSQDILSGPVSMGSYERSLPKLKLIESNLAAIWPVSNQIWRLSKLFLLSTAWGREDENSECELWSVCRTNFKCRWTRKAGMKTYCTCHVIAFFG